VNASFGLFGLLLAQPGVFPFFPLLPLFWIVALGLVAWVLVQGVGPRDRSGAARAREILSERYARGEISSDEYRERLEHLAAAAR
jgi:uncharacterized membrane protein